MTLIAFILISASLLMHSLWHFLCKSSGKPSMTFFALFSTSLLLTIMTLGLSSGILFEIPWDVFKYAAAGALFGVFCDVGLMLAYRYTDISMAYPMARALPVFFTMAVTSIFGWGKPLSLLAAIGMLIIFSGCLCMSFTGGGSELNLAQKIVAVRKGLIGILIAAIGTTGYTIVDNYGIKKITAEFPETGELFTAAAYSTCRESVAALSLWILLIGFNLCNKERGLLKTMVKTAHPYMAGFAAALAYLLVLVAMNHVSNVSFVQAFRQLSLPLSALLGFVILKEKVTSLRLIALFVIMTGLILSVI